MQRAALSAVALIALWGAAVPARGDCPDRPLTNGPAIGFSISSMLPGKLPGFVSRSFPLYGISGTLPLWAEAVNFGVRYAGVVDFSLLVGEIDYRHRLDTPFVNLYIDGGIHYFYYKLRGTAHQGPGGNAGLGIILPVGPTFQVTLGMKAYIRSYTLMSFGGGFTLYL